MNFCSWVSFGFGEILLLSWCPGSNYCLLREGGVGWEYDTAPPRECCCTQDQNVGVSPVRFTAVSLTSAFFPRQSGTCLFSLALAGFSASSHSFLHTHLLCWEPGEIRNQRYREWSRIRNKTFLGAPGWLGQ